MARQTKAAGPVGIGEGALAWAGLSGEDASERLVQALGCSAAEVLSIVRLSAGPVATEAAAVLAADGDAVRAAISDGTIDPADVRAAVIEHLATITGEAPHVEP